MHVDLGNCLAEVAEPGIPREGLDRLDEEVAAAHERIEAGRAAGEFGYVALDLAERTDPDAIRAAVEPFADAEAVLTVGIGGSALGASTVVDALAGGGAGAAGTDSSVGHHALDNVDPAHTRALLDALPLGNTAVHVVSKSGTTAETLANFLVVREAMADAGVDWTERTVVTTGESGPLRDLVDEHGLPSTPTPEGVP
ncbi:MAG TPA: glucose-6-phosphate isomerase, partial [Halobacteriales archaeon]|nr:glucose-6-phosphate isomerase [Halobacteriales archaeon]